MSVAILWLDGEVTQGKNATDLLENLCGGWNPNNVEQLRDVLANRACIERPSANISDDEFLQRLDAAGLLTYQTVIE